MKRLLPQTKSNSQGFTLIELLVVIAILAILGVIGLTVFSGVQKNARDARRKGDINAIVKALEANRGATAYIGLQNNQFAGGSIPQDTTTAQYCLQVGSAFPLTWPDSSPCPTTPMIPPYNPVLLGIGDGATSWVVCARLEGATLQTYCKQDVQ